MSTEKEIIKLLQSEEMLTEGNAQSIIFAKNMLGYSGIFMDGMTDKEQIELISKIIKNHLKFAKKRYKNMKNNMPNNTFETFWFDRNGNIKTGTKQEFEKFRKENYKQNEQNYELV